MPRKNGQHQMDSRRRSYSRNDPRDNMKIHLRFDPIVLAEGSCPSGKVRYANQADAAAALSNALRSATHGNHRRQECRIYRCDQFCGGWHTTSREERHTAQRVA